MENKKLSKYDKGYIAIIFTLVLLIIAGFVLQ